VAISACSFSEPKLTATPTNPNKQAWTEIDAASLLIDVRSPDEYASGHLDRAINIPHDKIAQRIAEISRAKDQSVVVYCKSGRRAGLAEATLREHGFTRVINAGGYESLVSEKN